MDFEYNSQLNIIGIDEAGRGPLAGPVVACAVLITSNHNIIEKVKDSKKMTETQREKVFMRVLEEKVPFTIGIAGNVEIDDVNILNATIRTINRAVEEMDLYTKSKIDKDFKVDRYIIDGKFPDRFSFKNYSTIIDGDNTHYPISLASIIAKVLRDRMMKGYSIQYPIYEFEKHKGYGTKRHYELLSKYGPSPIHRRTFLKLEQGY